MYLVVQKRIYREYSGDANGETKQMSLEYGKLKKIKDYLWENSVLSII